MPWSRSSPRPTGEGAEMRDRTLTGPWDAHVVLSALFGILALMALAFETIAPVPSRAQGADLVVAVLAVVGALTALLVVPRTGREVLLALVAASSVLTAVLVGVRTTQLGQASAAYLVMLVALFAALYLTHRQMLGEVVLLCGLFVVASVVGAGGLQPFYVGVRVVSVLLVAEVVSRLVTSQRRLLADIEGQASHDPLTGALNRRGAVADAEQVRSVVERAGDALTVSVIDLDGFKGYNDTRGHAGGDRLLEELVRDWTATLRVGDVLARIGGDEFLLVLPQTDPEGAAVLLGRMREANPYPWTVGTTVWRPEEDLFAAAARADEVLYVGKLRRHFQQAGPPVEE
jgi:diguanylate cyclase (GGDEF)-like protein